MDKNKLSKKDTEKIIEQQTGIISSLIDKLKEQNSKESKNKYKKSEGPSLPKFLKSKQFKPEPLEPEKKADQISDTAMKVPDKESASEILGCIYKLMEKNREEQVLDREEDKTKRKEESRTSDKMHDELIEAFEEVGKPEPSEFAKKVSAAKKPKMPKTRGDKGRKPAAKRPKAKKPARKGKAERAPKGKEPEGKAEAIPRGAGPKGEMPSVKLPPITGMKDVKQMVKSHEGVRNKPYKDSLGLWTVGVGHLIGDGKSLPPEWNRTLSDDEVNQLFEQDFVKHVKIAEQTPGYEKANEAGKGAFIDLAFNMGKWWPNFKQTAKSLEEGDFHSAAKGLQESRWYQQVGNRAKQIVALVDQAGEGKSTASPAESSPKSAGVAPVSDTNKNLKDDMSAQKQSNVVVNNTTNQSVSNRNTSPNPSPKKEDASPYMRKSYA